MIILSIQISQGHLGRHLEFYSYSSMLQRASTSKLLLRVQRIQPCTKSFYSKPLSFFSTKDTKQEAQLSLRDRAMRTCQLKSWQLLNDYTICLTNTDRVSVSASRLTLKSIHIAATEVNCTDKLARL